MNDAKNTPEDEGFLCICDATNPDWLAHVWIDGELVLTQEINSLIENPSVVGREHVRLIEQAEAEGKSWRAELRCPVCGGGNLFADGGMVEMIGVRGIKKAFVIGEAAHVAIVQSQGALRRAVSILTPAYDAGVYDGYTPVTIPSNSIWCGHDVVGSPITHELLATNKASGGQTVDVHVILCQQCAEESDALGEGGIIK